MWNIILAIIISPLVILAGIVSIAFIVGILEVIIEFILGIKNENNKS